MSAYPISEQRLGDSKDRSLFGVKVRGSEALEARLDGRGSMNRTLRHILFRTLNDMENNEKLPNMGAFYSSKSNFK